MKFEMPKGPLAEHTIRDIVRNAEAAIVPGAEPKEVLVNALLDHVAGDFAFTIKQAIADALDMADSIGMDDKQGAVKSALPDLAAQMGDDFDTVSFEGDALSIAHALAASAVRIKPVLPMNRGKTLSKYGIVDAHVKALGSTPPAAPTTPPVTVAFDNLAPAVTEGLTIGAVEVEQPEVTDPEMREMLGLAPLPGEAPTAPAPFVAAAPSAEAPHTTSADAPSAGALSPPPPPPSNPRDAFVLMREATELDDAALSKRLGISRSTIHNYMSGRTAKVKCSAEQARVMAAEIDVRVAKLRQAAEIFAMVRD